jgi:hypothetical protein
MERAACGVAQGMESDLALALFRRLAGSYVLKIKLQSARVYMHEEEVSGKTIYLVGVSV